MSQSHYIYTTVVAINVMAFDVFVVVDDGKGTEIKSWGKISSRPLGSLLLELCIDMFGKSSLNHIENNNNDGNLMVFANQCPLIQEINLENSLIDVSLGKMEWFAKIFDPQLRRCNFSNCKGIYIIFPFIKILSDKLRNIQDIKSK